MEVIGVESKTSKNGKPFDKLTLSNGKTINIFDKKESFEEGQRVRMIVKPDGKYFNFVGVVEASAELVKKPKNADIWDGIVGK